MSSLQLKDLFEHLRFPNDNSLLGIILYFPFGLLLSSIRVFIAFHAYIAACLLPKSLPIRRYVLRVMCAIIGLVVNIKDHRKVKKHSPLLIANHVSIFDHLAINLCLPNVTPSTYGLPTGLAWLLGYQDMGVQKGTDELIKNVKQYCENETLPVLVFPEGTTTRGSAGLLAFNDWPFSLHKTIQPISIKVSRPVVPISISPLASYWWADFYWLIFSPVTVFNIELLPTVDIGERETSAEFCNRTAQAIAANLNVTTTLWTDKDKSELVKKLLHSHQRDRKVLNLPRVQPTQLPSSERKSTEQIAFLTSQVQAVLPDVSLDTIQADIARTLSVDKTIANILEGSVKEELPPSTSTADSMIFSAKEFSKNSSNRQLSFEERKELMFAMARARYKLKHGLN